jgi:GTP-binding protein
MIIKTARFVISNSEVEKCPKPNKPEYAFIGRSNVGKSSLINMLTGFSKLAKTSGRPGKTRLINHFIINDEWYLVDLPGFGFAKVSKSDRIAWEKFIRKYLLTRENLYCVCLLVDSRHEPQPIDLEFMQWLGESGIPFVIVFTKADKLNKTQMQEFQEKYSAKLLETWEESPLMFVTSAETAMGREELLKFIDQVNKANVKA